MPLNRYKSVIIGILIIFSQACGNKIPKKVIQPEEMKKIMWEMMVSDQLLKQDTSKFIQKHASDTSIQLFQKVLLSHDISVNQFKSSLKFYEADPILFQALMDSVKSYGNQLNVDLDSSYLRHNRAKLAADKLHTKTDTTHSHKPVADSIKNTKIPVGKPSVPVIPDFKNGNKKLQSNLRLDTLKAI